jgi:DNA-binding XRE family transcriptional regulator
MQVRKNNTEFGREVDMFCYNSGITKKELANLAGVSRSSLIKEARGVEANKQLVPKCRAFMDAYKAGHPEKFKQTS